MKDRDDLIIVTGTSRDLGSDHRVLVNEGDTVICEMPLRGSPERFQGGRREPVGVEMEDDGISIEKLEKALQDNKTPSFCT